MISGCTYFMHKRNTFYSGELDLKEATFRKKRLKEYTVKCNMCTFTVSCAIFVWILLTLVFDAVPTFFTFDMV